MTERQKIILAIVSALAVVGLLVALLLPSRNVNNNPTTASAETIARMIFCLSVIIIVI